MKNSNIQWTDHTFNPWIGCTKVSPGCANCYAEARDLRFAGGIHWGIGAKRHRTTVANWEQPLKWNREAADIALSVIRGGEFSQPRPRVFCASLADWLDDEVPVQWLAELLELIAKTPNLDWLLLTKRPQNWRSRLEIIEGMAADANPVRKIVRDWLDGNPPANVWVGTTVEDQTRADERIPELLSIPAKVRFLSCEPLLGLVDLAMGLPGTGVRKTLAGIERFHVTGIDWLIVGGESGHGARGFCVEYAWELVLQCKKAGVPVFVKQLGARPYTTNANAMEWPDHVTFEDIGIGAAANALIGLNDRKGGEFDEFPEGLRVREFPNTNRQTTPPSANANE